MTDSFVTCPKCGESFEVTEAFRKKLQDGIKEELEGALKNRADALSAKEKSLDDRANEYQMKLDEVESRIAAAVKDKEKIALEHARDQVAVELTDLAAQVKTLKAQKADAEKRELALLKRERDVKEKADGVELEILRRVSEATKEVEESAALKVEEKHRLTLAEKEAQLNAFKDQVFELERKLAQSSQQTQGEVLELEIEQVLREYFKMDNILPVPKGVAGADVIQSVIDNLGGLCGTLVWETKRTKNWSDNWVGKLRQDLTEVMGDIGVIVTSVTPKGIRGFGAWNGIWVTEPAYAISLAVALRHSLIEITKAKNSVVAKSEKAEALHSYLTGSAFQRRIETVVAAFVELNDELAKEKRATQRLWTKRETEIQRALTSTAKMYGELQGIIGAGLSTIPQLQLDASESDDGIARIPPVESSDGEVEDLPF